MLRFGRRLGISADTIETVKIARIAKSLHCLPSQVRAERADDIETFMQIEEIEKEKATQENNQ